MILNFIFSNFNAIVLGIWLLFAVIVTVRYFQPSFIRCHNRYLLKVINKIKNISYLKLIIIALGLNIFFGLFISVSLYYVWGLSDPSGTYIQLPYFLGYIWTNVWLDISISFFLSGLLYSVFKVWKYYRGGFIENGPELLLILMLISGFPKILVFIIIGFIFIILSFIFSYFFKHKKNLIIEPAFIVALFLTLLLGNIVVSYLYQYHIVL